MRHGNGALSGEGIRKDLLKPVSDKESCSATPGPDPILATIAFSTGKGAARFWDRTGDEPMTQQKHLIQIHRSNDHLCPGVRLTRYYALTAAHCLGGNKEECKQPVTLCLADGRELEGEVEDFDLLTDMALLKIVFPKGERVPLPHITFGFAQKNEPWAAAHRPSDNCVALKGTVSHVSVIYQRTDGQTASSHRLWHDGTCDEVHKFYGSPVDRDESGRSTAVIGLLVGRPADTDAPQETLFAGTIEEAVLRFRELDFQHRRAGHEPSDPGRVYTVIQDPQTEAKARKDNTVPSALERAGVADYVNLRWHRP
ncbi:serine protease [Streptomyces sp. NBC_01381]|uniref:S1 family peptidase n=1 Tax=Streptomyces sp. NBC_01381 TaxID=2903845 RepID=UPI002257794E|nr:serine protease [Streptomyces sp. NBC_01381]MCX4670868.1 serine protease [Streptomyces sp. NBC_01381]